MRINTKKYVEQFWMKVVMKMMVHQARVHLAMMMKTMKRKKKMSMKKKIVTRIILKSQCFFSSVVENKPQTIIDQTETNLVALRRTIYLTIQSSIGAEECAHKLLKMNLRPGQEVSIELASKFDDDFFSL